jgi:predicted membrane protein
MALLCLVPNLLAASWRPAHQLSLVLAMGWLVVNPWSLAMSSNMMPTDAPPEVGELPQHLSQWLTRISVVTFMFVWIAYVPSWILPWALGAAAARRIDSG